METIVLVLGIAGIFGAIFLALTAIGVFTNEARGVSKSLAVIEAFSPCRGGLVQRVRPVAASSAKNWPLFLCVSP